MEFKDHRYGFGYATNSLLLMVQKSQILWYLIGLVDSVGYMYWGVLNSCSLLHETYTASGPIACDKDKQPYSPSASCL